MAPTVGAVGRSSAVNAGVPNSLGAQASTAVKTWPCAGGCHKGMPAPGATCPDCILARRRAREATVRAAAGTGEARAESLASSPDIAQARDRAVLQRLAHSPASMDALIACLPDEGLSAAAREQACRSALTRLRVKGKVKIVADGWAAA